MIISNSDLAETYVICQQGGPFSETLWRPRAAFEARGHSFLLYRPDSIQIFSISPCCIYVTEQRSIPLQQNTRIHCMQTLWLFLKAAPLHFTAF